MYPRIVLLHGRILSRPTLLHALPLALLRVFAGVLGIGLLGRDVGRARRGAGVLLPDHLFVVLLRVLLLLVVRRHVAVIRAGRRDFAAGLAAAVCGFGVAVFGELVCGRVFVAVGFRFGSVVG